ncbi:MAG TPA: arylamine N-acetyltransferase [Phenylobacterium sp.]
MVQLSDYLNRIGHQGEVRPDLATLTALHRAHLTSVPYENLDVQFGRPLTTDPAAAAEKIATRGRGGWCYEMNGAFGWALEQIGFEVTRISCDGNDRGSHLILQVVLDGLYICDVGFGDGPMAPFPLREGPIVQRGYEYRLERLEAGWRFHNHRFGLAPNFEFAGPDEAALAERCQVLQSDPNSTFVQNAVVCRHDEVGYSTMIGRVLRTSTATGGSKRLIEDADAYVRTLRERFGLDMPQAAELWPAICARHEALFGAGETASPAA